MFAAPARSVTKPAKSALAISGATPATAAKRAQPGGPFTADMAATRASREAGRGTFDVQAGLAAPSAEQRRESGGASAMGRAFRDKPTANATSGKHSKL